MSRFRASDLRGSARMAVQATAGVARVVEGVHQSVLGSMGLPGGTEPGRTRGLTGMVYQGIHGITRLVDQGLQAGLLRIEPLLDRVMTGADTGTPAAEREAVRMVQFFSYCAWATGGNAPAWAISTYSALVPVMVQPMLQA